LPHGRALHRRDHGLPHGPGRAVGEPHPALVEGPPRRPARGRGRAPATAFAAAAGAAQAGGRFVARGDAARRHPRPGRLSRSIEMSSTDFALAVEDLTVSFDGFKAIDDLTLYVDKNELRVIIGPNGAGKTTLLDLICGKAKASGGSIKFKNEEILQSPEHKRVRLGIGRKFQTPSIYENLSVWQNLEVSYPSGRSVWGALAFSATDEIQARVRAVAGEIGLTDRLETEAGLLSHGQKQWLEIGMLLMQEPELLMLDEPIAGMSARERDLTAELLHRICQNRAVIVIEHDMDFVKKIAHKVTVMHQGKILAEGPMEQVQADPKVIDVYLGH